MVVEGALEDWLGAVWALDDVLEQSVGEFERGQVVARRRVDRRRQVLHHAQELRQGVRSPSAEVITVLMEVCTHRVALWLCGRRCRCLAVELRVSRAAGGQSKISRRACKRGRFATRLLDRSAAICRALLPWLCVLWAVLPSLNGKVPDPRRHILRSQLALSALPAVQTAPTVYSCPV